MSGRGKPKYSRETRGSTSGKGKNVEDGETNQTIQDGGAHSAVKTTRKIKLLQMIPLVNVVHVVRWF